MATYVISDPYARLLTWANTWSAEYPDAQEFDSMTAAKKRAAAAAKRLGDTVGVYTNWGYEGQALVLTFDGYGRKK